MKIQTILITLLFCSTTLFGQTKKESQNPPPPTSFDKNHQCGKTHKYSFADRLKNYPFDKANAVLIVSFNYSVVETYIITPNNKDSTAIYSEGRLPIKDDTLSYADLAEKFKLNEKQIDSLTNILFNYDYKGKIEFELTSLCFDPHNAIVFLDNNGKMFEYIEICFLCDRINVSSEKIKTGNFCHGKYELLKTYFRQIGLKIGVEK